MRNKIFSILLLSLFLTASASAKDVYLTMGKDALQFQSSKFGQRLELVEESEEIVVIKIDEEALPYISYFMHDEFNRCGGFVFHENEEDARNTLAADDKRAMAKSSFFSFYQIDNEKVVRDAIAQVDPSQIKQTIEQLSNFNNRYYQSQTGVDAAKWIKNQWQMLSKHRSDVTVELYEHRSWDQPSVIMTVQGQSDDIVVVGGHLDSIAGFWGRSSARAPGADDNASGIATITEVIRVLMNSNFKPVKTLKFMGYAAEEVGLRGSKEIAQSMRAQGANVIGALQLDMTNFKGTEDLDIVMMTDFTNEEQNAFVGTLIDTYLPDVSWGYDRCGYACSDHASWHNEGFPASMPFESRMRESNRNIHTSRDTLDQSRGSTSHASKFARMALAFVLELD